jgi:hypothetical protein
MDDVALRILKEVATRAELPLSDALKLVHSKHKSHLDQYPLALLLEEGYLGLTLSHTPPTGAETMREFTLATTLHMFTLPKDPEGRTQYLGVTSSGSVKPENERVFIKAKGALYLGEIRQKLRDRLWSFVLGFLAGTLVAVASAWFKGQLKLP